jgi:putative nucleotidyltransferase with HDIG domain
MAAKSQRAHRGNGICRSRVASIISQGLESLPHCVFDLDALLNAMVIDLTRVTRTLARDPAFSRRVLHLSNTVLKSSGETARNSEDAVILLGPSLFHAVILLCAVTQVGASPTWDENAEGIWLHSLEMAVLSEQIAEESKYPFPETACLAGLLHDIGYLPLLVAAREQANLGRELSDCQWRDDVKLEHEIFGVDHCQVGRWMAKSWNLSPTLIDAVSNHHDPSKVKEDAHLAEILYAAEHNCSALSYQEIENRPQINRGRMTRLLQSGDLSEAYDVS